MKLSALIYNEILGKMLLSIFRIKPTINQEKSSMVIKNMLLSDKPLFIGRFGSSEIRGMILPKLPKLLQIPVKRKVINTMVYHAGFFPYSYEKIEQFSKLCINDLKELDVLASWRIEELYYRKTLDNVIKVNFSDLEPFLQNTPWSEALFNKRVLVVHPFGETIKQQYEKNRQFLFKNTKILPEFKELIIVKSVQTIGGNNADFSDWFEALNYMENEISKIDFDIALLGCGAYGMPLCAHIKRMGKKAIYMGGVLQMLFGIKGKRWENQPTYQSIINEYFVKPNESEKPNNWEESKSLIDSNSVGGYW
jgi:hypothetical protein